MAVVPLTGHVAPVTGLVAELVARGHDVRVYTGAGHLARFAELGARVVPWTAAQDFDEEDLAGSFPRAGRSRTQRMLTLVRDGFIGTAPGQVSDLRTAITQEPADVLLADSRTNCGPLGHRESPRARAASNSVRATCSAFSVAAAPTGFAS